MIAPCYFIDLDTQFDFFDPGGMKHIHEAASIRPNLKLLTQQARKRKLPLLSFVESYELDSGKQRNSLRFGKPLTRTLPHFEGERQWEAYCLQGSRGAKKIPETQLSRAHVIPFASKKNFFSKKPAFSDQFLSKHPQIIIEKRAFDIFSNISTLPLLHSTPIRKAVVYGAGLDYGLEAAVLKLLEKGFQVWIPVDAVQPIHEENRERVLIELRKKGAQMWSTAFILEQT